MSSNSFLRTTGSFTVLATCRLEARSPFLAKVIIFSATRLASLAFAVVVVILSLSKREVTMLLSIALR